MKQGSNTPTISLLAIFVWPIVSISFLYVFAAYVWPLLISEQTTYTTSWDAAFFAYALTTLVGHVVAYCIVPILILSLVKHSQYISKLSIIILAAMGMLVGLGQLFLRNANAGLSHIDCNYDCASATVLPKVLDEQVTIMLVPLLMVTYFCIVGFAIWTVVRQQRLKAAVETETI